VEEKKTLKAAGREKERNAHSPVVNAAKERQGEKLGRGYFIRVLASKKGRSSADESKKVQKGENERRSEGRSRPGNFERKIEGGNRKA